MADASPIPVLLYSVPVFTGVTLEAPEIAVMAQHPNIVGIKDSSGPRLACRGDLRCGAARVPDSGRSTGYVAGVADGRARGAESWRWLQRCRNCAWRCSTRRERGPVEKARELQVTVLKAAAAIVSETGIAGIKFVMDQRGYRGGIPRLPLVPPSDAAKRRMLEALACPRTGGGFCLTATPHACQSPRKRPTATLLQIGRRPRHYRYRRARCSP